MNPQIWYSKNTSSGQALVIDEATGANIAVAYDPQHGALLAAAPELLALARHITAMADDSYLVGHPEWLEMVTEARAATEKATSTN